MPKYLDDHGLETLWDKSKDTFVNGFCVNLVDDAESESIVVDPTQYTTHSDAVTAIDTAIANKKLVYCKYVGSTSTNYFFFEKKEGNNRSFVSITAAQISTVNIDNSSVILTTVNTASAGVEYVTSSNTFAEVDAIYRAGKLPIYRFALPSTPVYFYLPMTGHPYTGTGSYQFSGACAINGKQLFYISLTSSGWGTLSEKTIVTEDSDIINLKQGLQSDQGTQIPANADLNDYATPGNYYIESDSDMVTISNTPFTQMGFTSSETSKTGPSQLTVYNMDGTDTGRVMQVMYTIYSSNPTGDNTFGFWYRMNNGGVSPTWGVWGDWHRMLQTNGYAPYRYSSETPSTATKTAELLKVKVGSTTTYQSITLGVTISSAVSNLQLFAIVTFSVRGNTPKLDAQVITSNFSDNGLIIRFCAYNDGELNTTFHVTFPYQDDLTWLNVTYQVLDHTGVLYESKTFPSFNNVWLLYNPQLFNSIPVYTAYTDLHWNRYLDARTLSNRTNWKITATSDYIGLKPGVYGAGTGDFVYFKLFSGTLANWTSIIVNLLWIQGANMYNNEDALDLSIRINFQTDLTAPSLAVINYGNPTGMSNSGDRVPYSAFHYKVENGTITVYLRMKTAGNYQQNLLLKSYSSNMSNVVFYKAESINEGTVPSGLTQISSMRRPLYKSSTSAIGSSTRPVYVDAYGQVVACTYAIVASTTGTDTNTIYLV